MWIDQKRDIFETAFWKNIRASVANWHNVNSEEKAKKKLFALPAYSSVIIYV